MKKDEKQIILVHDRVFQEEASNNGNMNWYLTVTNNVLCVGLCTPETQLRGIKFNMWMKWKGLENKHLGRQKGILPSLFWRVLFYKTWFRMVW